MRRRLRRAHQGQAVPRDRRAGARGAEEPQPSRCRRLRPEALGRRRPPDPDSRPLLPRGDGEAGAEASARRAVRRRHGVPAARPRLAHRLRIRDRARHQGRGPGAARLARRAGRQFRPRRGGEAARAGDPAGVHRPRPARHRDRRARAQALHHPQELRARHPGPEPQARQGVLRAVDVGAHCLLQRHAARAPGGRVLPRSEGRARRIGARPGAPALLHQHLPVVGPGAPLPHDLPQRRDQHAARQRQLDPRPPGRHLVAHLAGRSGENLAPDLRRPVGFGLVRQRARAAGDGRLLGGARDDDDDPGGVGEPHADGSGAARVLRVPRRDDGALGRPGFDRVHRRPADRRDARPQRPAALALHRHRRRSGDHGLGVRLPADPRGEDRQEVAPAARQDVPRRPGERPHRRRQGAEGHPGERQAVRRLDRAHPRAPRRGRHGENAAAQVGRGAARPPAGIRLHAGGSEVHPAADERRRRGADRLDGQRLAARGAVEQGQDALPLFQAAVRAGHQPGDRPDSRGPGDVAGLVHRAQAQPARHRRAQPAAAPGSDAAGARLLRDGEDPAHRALHRRQVPRLRARRHLSGGVGQGGGGGAPGVAVRAGGGRGALRLLDHRDLGPPARPRARGDSGAARGVGDTPAPRWQGAAHLDRPGGGDRQRARGASLRAAGRLRRRGGASVSRARNPPFFFARQDESRQELRQGDRQGTEEGDVQDGHLDVHVLHRLAAVRGGGPGALAGRQVLHRHRLEHRGHRPVRHRRGSDPRAPCGLRRARSGARRDARRGRRIRLARARRGPRLDARRARQAAARLARELVRDVQGIRGDHQRPVEAAHDVPRAVRVPVWKSRTSGRGRARGRDREALLHRGDVARLDLDRGAHHARDRHEPHRRKVEYRRGRRGSAALPAGHGRRIPAEQAGKEPGRGRPAAA